MSKKQGIPRGKIRDIALDKIIERLEIWMGARGNRLDEVVTYRDLIESKLGRLSKGGALLPGDNVGIPTTTVGKLSNLTANGAFQNIILAWEGINQEAYSYTEIWRSEDDNLGNAELVGSTPAAVYSDPVSNYVDYYYWVRAVSTSGNPGPYNATGGTVAKISPDYETVRDYLTATEWQASTTYAALNSVVPTTEIEVDGVAIRLLAIVGGTTGASEPDWGTAISAIDDTVVDGTVTWQAVEAGKIPFYVDPATGLVVIDGAALRDASIDNAKIGNLAADKIFAAVGTIAEALIGSGHITNAMISNIIQSNNYSAGSAGWIINKSGAAEFNNITARGHIEADSGYIAGTLQIGGTGSDFNDIITMAQDAESAANSANSKVSAWTRPGTTLINGNKIYTGDAYVDTLQIKGHAVTVLQAQSGGSGNSASGLTHTIHSFSMNHGDISSRPVLISAGAYILPGKEGGAERKVSANLRLVVNGAVVASWNDTTDGLRGFSVVVNVGSGSKSITLQVVTESANVSNTFWSRGYLTATACKR